MARFRSDVEFIYDNLNLNRLNQYFISIDFFDNTNERIAFNGTRFEDNFVIVWNPGTSSNIHSIFAGNSITNINKQVSGGVVTGYFEANYNGQTGVYLWGIEDVSIPAIQIAAAAVTPSASDDYVLIDNMFAGNDHIILSSGNDLMRAGGGNDFIQGYGGNDFLFGGIGIDTAWYRGVRSDYFLTSGGGSVYVSDKTNARDGLDTLSSIERLQFADGTLALDTSGNAGQVYRLYQAAFARTPDNAGLKHNIGLVDGGLSLTQMSSAFLASAEFQQKYGANPTDTAYINALYRNVLGRDADAAGLQGWQGRLNDGSWNRTTLLIGFSESPENIASVAPAIANGIFLL